MVRATSLSAAVARSSSDASADRGQQDQDVISMAELGAAGRSRDEDRQSSLAGNDAPPSMPFSAIKALTAQAPSLFERMRRPVTRHALAFFLFGLLNNALYVVILTAALELIPKGTPTGIVAFFNIFPALVAKAVWPYVLKGEVRYVRRITSCVAMNATGIVIIALLPPLATRLSGIALASFSSGLGELTFLQLSTRYGSSGAGRGVGWFSSGTGAAGFVGAMAWWIVRPLGVRVGLLSLIFMPFLMTIAYGLVLPSVDEVEASEDEARGKYARLFESNGQAGEDEEEEEEAEEEEDDSDPPHPDQQHAERRHSLASRRSTSSTGPPIVPLSVSPHASAVPTLEDGKSDCDAEVVLSLSDKMQLIQPMLFVFIIPLVLVYFFEYTINQGIAPTLLYPVPTPSEHPLLSLIIKNLKDYYPLYQLTYQTFVFISRSSISLFGLPAIPKRYLWLPAIIQGSLLVLLVSESLHHWFRDSIARPLAIVCVCVEGLAGGSAYVSVFYQIGTDQGRNHDPDDGAHESQEAEDGQVEGRSLQTPAQREIRRAQEHEFRIGCVGVGDTMGILVASLVSVPLEITLCDAQVRRGYDLCKKRDEAGLQYPLRA